MQGVLAPVGCLKCRRAPAELGYPAHSRTQQTVHPWLPALDTVDNMRA